jgi:hypothetical protein
MKLGEVGSAITTIKLYLTQYLGVIYLLTEASVGVLDKARSKNYPIGHFQEFLIVITFRTGDTLCTG